MKRTLFLCTVALMLLLVGCGVQKRENETTDVIVVIEEIIVTEVEPTLEMC